MHSPLLLAKVQVRIAKEDGVLERPFGAPAWQRLSAFRRWFEQRAAPHCQRLGVRLCKPLEAGGPAAAAATQAELAACLWACAEHTQLAELRITADDVALRFGGELAALTHLRPLWLDVMQHEDFSDADLSLTLAASLQPLAALEELLLSGKPILMPAAVQLPEALTSLDVCSHPQCPDSLVQQVCGW